MVYNSLEDPLQLFGLELPIQTGGCLHRQIGYLTGSLLKLQPLEKLIPNFSGFVGNETGLSFYN